MPAVPSYQSVEEQFDLSSLASRQMTDATTEGPLSQVSQGHTGTASRRKISSDTQTLLVDIHKKTALDVQT